MNSKETGPNPSNPSLAERNDAFRQTCIPFVTAGVLFLDDVPDLIQAVREFDDFTSDNDPYGEHDFGALMWAAERVYWKIDYYDQDLRSWRDPQDPDCQRILTILLASEY